jgi:hypothetical protein
VSSNGAMVVLIIIDLLVDCSWEGDVGNGGNTDTDNRREMVVVVAAANRRGNVNELVVGSMMMRVVMELL